jgi:hypothetical protein
MSLKNWQNFQFPHAPLGNFLRSEPFPSEEVKATYIDRPRKKRKKKRDIKAGQVASALARSR